VVCRRCGCEIDFSFSHEDPISCVRALRIENEILRQLLYMTLEDGPEHGERVAGDSVSGHGKPGEWRTGSGGPM
jgi:hypothetical protein